MMVRACEVSKLVAPPLPALRGERVGVRGSIHELHRRDSRHAPLYLGIGVVP
jgi:hypothetical protein